MTVIDCDGIGGACVLWDCVPSKTFIASTGVRTELRRADGLGFDIELEDAKISLPEIHNRVKTLARPSRPTSAPNCSPQGVSVVHGRGELVDDVPGMAHHRVEGHHGRRQGRVLKAEVVLIATGASPACCRSAEPDGERILNWRQLYDLAELPEHLVVVGSGVTGAEFFSAYTEMGVQVTLVASRDRVLPARGRRCRRRARGGVRRTRGELVKHARADSVERTADGVGVTLSDGRTVEGSHALMTVGSMPNTGGLGLEKVGIELDRAATFGWTGFRAPRRRGSTRRGTAPDCCRWRRWRPCRGGSRCITPWARGFSRSG